MSRTCSPLGTMPRDRKSDGTLLATLLVLFLGFIAVVFVCAIGSRHPERDAGIATAVFVLVVLLITGLRERVTGPIEDYAAWMLRERRGDPLGDYKPEKKDEPARRYGTQKPASAEDIQKIREQANVWTPADARRKRKKR